MARYITISLDKRGVSGVARLLDEEAPRTAKAILDALPLSGQASTASMRATRSTPSCLPSPR